MTMNQTMSQKDMCGRPFSCGASRRALVTIVATGPGGGIIRSG
jgi:hypothetical protein